jgi:hypothetical protein
LPGRIGVGAAGPENVPDSPRIKVRVDVAWAVAAFDMCAVICRSVWARMRWFFPVSSQMIFDV